MKELKVGKLKLVVKQGDITQEKVDAIVNAANSGLRGGGGVDGAIHRAGGPAIREECRKIIAKIGRLPAGEAVITTSGRLPAQYVIHTVGPIYRGGKSGEEEKLFNAYYNSLKLADEKQLETIAFPAISCGVYGYPFDEALKVSKRAIETFSQEAKSIKEIRLVYFSEGEYHKALEFFEDAERN